MYHSQSINPLSIDDLKSKVKELGKGNFSIDLKDALDMSEDKNKLKFLVKNSIGITSDENKEVAALFSNLIKVSFDIQSRHKDPSYPALKIAHQSTQNIADAKALELYPTIQKLELDGLNDHLIAQALTKTDILTPKGKKNWRHDTVQRIRNRVENINQPKA